MGEKWEEVLRDWGILAGIKEWVGEGDAVTGVGGGDGNPTITTLMIQETQHPINIPPRT
jgi:hypothetical protein